MKKVLLCAMLLSGCVGPTGAEKATYETIAPEHRAYVEADETLNAGQKQRRFDLLESWRIAVGAEK